MDYTIAADGKSITCHRCGLTSHNAQDVAEHYCGNCHTFHDDNQFDCRECGRHIITIGNNPLAATHPNTCAACWSLPGWFNNPEIADAIDPEHNRHPPGGERLQ